MTSSNGNIFRVTGPLCGEFTGPGEFPAQRPVTRSFDVFFDLPLNKRLSKQPWGWWFETPAWSLWRHRNAIVSMPNQHIGLQGPVDVMHHWYPFGLRRNQYQIDVTFCVQRYGKQGENPWIIYVTNPVIYVTSFYQLYNTCPFCWRYSFYVCRFI